MQTNWYLTFGLLTYGVISGLKQFIELPHFIYSISLGLSVALIMYGIYSLNHDTSKTKNIKRNLFAKLTKQTIK